MGFEVIEKQVGRATAIGVSIASGKPKKPEIKNRTIIVIGSDVLTSMKWERGSRIEAALNGKQLRLKQGDLSGFKLVMGRRSKSGRLQLAVLGGAPVCSRKTAPHKIENDALYITLPDWAVKAAP